MSSERSQLRRELRRARRNLTPQQQRKASQKLLQQLAQHPLFRRSRHIAFYLANDGEIDPAALMEQARRMGKHCYLPVLSEWPANRMNFQRLVSGQRWTRNRSGIRAAPPAASPQARAWRLELVIPPVVGCDEQGSRLGIGGRSAGPSFGHASRTRVWSRPRLLGLA